MCEAIDNLIKEEVKEELKEMAQNFFENGVDFEMVRKSIRHLSDDELKEIYDKATKSKQ